MEAFSSFLLTAEKKRKVENARTLTEAGPPGTSYFFEMSSNPVTSVFLTSGPLKENSDSTHEVHMRLVHEPIGYPEQPKKGVETERKGYRMYMQKKVDAYKADNSVGLNIESFETYVSKFYNVTMAIDRAIFVDHGVKVYEDGDMDNDILSNVIILHPCDIMNIYVEAMSNNVPELYVTSETLPRMSANTRNVLVHSMFDDDQLTFFEQEIDFIYLCYCYYGNYSYLPIRTRVPIESEVFTESSFFTNFDHFVQHQIGKLRAVNQDNRDIWLRMKLRSI
jgi:hypothetical protein